MGYWGVVLARLCVNGAGRDIEEDKVEFETP
jgi:hypothetical protein